MLSVVIPSYQRSDLLLACLLAVTRHAPAGSEIIVVDDASPGGCASEVAARFEGVRVVPLPRRSGFAVAANAGIRASQGDVIELLNDDTEVQPGWADAILAWFDDPAVGSVAPLVLTWPTGETIDSAGDRYHIAGVAGKRGRGRPALDFTQPCRVFGVSATAGFYRRSALDRVGLFPESFGSYFEDVDLAFRLNRAGYSAMFEPASRVLHHVSASYGTVGRKLIERQSCNEERVYWRNLPGAMLRRSLPMHAAVLLAKAHRRWHEGTLTPWLFGRLRALRDWRSIRAQRAEIARWANSDGATWNLGETIAEIEP